MAWLWLVSVGVTDVQFPAWQEDENGHWSQFRFEVGRAGCRAVHEHLLMLMARNLIDFPEQLPMAVRRETARDLRLDLEEEEGDFIATIRTANSRQLTGYRISNQGDAIPNQHQPRLPVYCPKVEEVLNLAKETFGADPVTVVVFNTRRAKTLRDGPDEPIASGPVVARFLAERLGLNWSDCDGEIPKALTPGISTWIDIMKGEELLEDPQVQQEIVRRITKAISVWHCPKNRQVAITTAGGMPPLKPIIERVPATCLGQDSIRVLERQERGPLTVTALNFNDRVAERETLRFHCAEALRQGDYASAYGLASRFRDQPWAAMVRNQIGPFLELPCDPSPVISQGMEPYALRACQVEVALCMGDVAGALRRLGPFVESTIWAVMERNKGIKDLGLRHPVGEEFLYGELPRYHEFLERDMLVIDEIDSRRYRVLSVNRGWVSWLVKNAESRDGAESALNRLNIIYNSEVPRGGMSARKYRNQLAHGASNTLNVNDIEVFLKKVYIIKGKKKTFGQNFLAGDAVNNLLTRLDYPDFAKNVGEQLAVLLGKVTGVK